MMVGFNVTLPWIRILWVGKLTWKSGLVALIAMGRPVLIYGRHLLVAVRIRKGMTDGRLSCLLLACPSLFPQSWFDLPCCCCWELTPFAASKVVIVDLLISGSQSSGLLVSDPDCGSALPWELSNYHNNRLSLPSSQWETAVGLLQLLKRPASRPSDYQIRRFSGVI